MQLLHLHSLAAQVVLHGWCTLVLLILLQHDAWCWAGLQLRLLTDLASWTSRSWPLLRRQHSSACHAAAVPLCVWLLLL